MPERQDIPEELPEDIPECQRPGWVSPLVGKPCPVITDLLFVKGDPVIVGKELPFGCKVLVVEFWATWCPPCHESMILVTQFQAKYKDLVVFVAVSREEEEKVREFVDEKDEDMEYRVAVDVNRTAHKAILAPAQRPYYPSSVLVVDNLVRLVSSPTDEVFEEALEQAVKESYPIPREYAAAAEDDDQEEEDEDEDEDEEDEEEKENGEN